MCTPFPAGEEGQARGPLITALVFTAETDGSFTLSPRQEHSHPASPSLPNQVGA